MMQQLAWLRAQVASLSNQAAKHAASGGRSGDPELYAEIVLDNLPPYIPAEMLFQRLSAPDALDQLATLDARVTQYRPWFDAFRQAVLDSFSPDDGAGEGEGGDES